MVPERVLIESTKSLLKVHLKDPLTFKSVIKPFLLGEKVHTQLWSLVFFMEHVNSSTFSQTLSYAVSDTMSLGAGKCCISFLQNLTCKTSSEA